MTQLSLLSPAKLNLFLHITGKRLDGYHNLQTVFRLLDWGDNMRFEISSDLAKNYDCPFRLHCSKKLTENPEDNLIIKAANALVKLNKTKNLPIIDIYLEKNIPTGAGLGGGSSNAATTLMALNELWQLELNKQQLINIGVKLGADVPIFIFKQDAIAEGIGDLLTSINLPKQSYLLLTPTAHIATGELFAHPHLCRNKSQMGIEQIAEKSENFLQTLNPPFNNVFEPVVTQLSQEVDTALSYLRTLEQQTNSTARMTGSGSCVFLPLAVNQIDSTMDAEKAQISDWLNNAPCNAYLVNSQ